MVGDEAMDLSASILILSFGFVLSLAGVSARTAAAREGSSLSED